MHSLEVHQQELEVQNDELRTANDALSTSNLALEVSRDRFRALYDFAPIPYVTIDATCTISDVNRATEVMLDTTRDHLVGGRFDLFVADANRPDFNAFIASVFAAGVALSAEVALVRERAPAVEALVHGVVICDDLGSPFRCVLGIVDITVRKRAEVARRQAQEEVLAVVSHDLRGPLNSISLACDGLASGIPADQHRECVLAIERATQRCERLIKNLLGVAHIESGRFELDLHTLDACELTRSIYLEHQMEAVAAGCSLTASIPTDPILVRGDRDRLEQVLSNLLGNAVVHARGAAIEVTVARRDEDVVIAVADTGSGIPADELPRIFERYRQGKHHHGGAGLGLAIVKGLVLAHGGTVTVRSEAGRGARFEVTLPAEPPAPADAR